MSLTTDLLEDLNSESFGPELANSFTQLPALTFIVRTSDVPLPANLDSFLRGATGADGQTDILFTRGDARHLVDNVRTIRTALTLGLLHRCIIHKPAKKYTAFVTKFKLLQKSTSLRLPAERNFAVLLEDFYQHIDAQAVQKHQKIGVPF